MIHNLIDFCCNRPKAHDVMSPPQQLYAPVDDVNLYKSPDEMAKLLQKQQEALKNDMMRKRSLMEKALQQQVQVSLVTSQTLHVSRTT